MIIAMAGRLAFLLLFVSALSLGTGCLSAGKADYVTSRSVALADSSDEADRYWEAAQDTLRRNRFRLDRVDRRAGVITTMPVVSQHFLEFWRHDVDTQADLWESTLNPIRRWVEVVVKRDGRGAWQALDVIVHKERFSAPDRQFNSTGAAYQFFGSNLPSTTGAERVMPEDERWLDLGRDPAMEAYLLAKILDRVGAGTESATSEG